MAISFQCPQGHKLSCPDERAGLRGKCPKCGSIFQVPNLVEEPAAESGEAGAGDSFLRSLAGGTQLTTSESGTAIGKRRDHFEDFTGAAADLPEAASRSGSAPAIEAPAPEAAPREETIMFLCPSGHKLNAPKSLQGKPGKCPHCGEKFLVPVLDEESSVEDAGNFLDSLTDANPPEEAHTESSAAPAVETPSGVGSGFFSGLAPEDEFVAGLAETSSQAMAMLFSRLWADRGETGVLELYLKGGEILTPRWFAPQLSQSAYGMFAFVEADGSHTLTAVQWDAIERIALRGLPTLPDGVFEE